MMRRRMSAESGAELATRVITALTDEYQTINSIAAQVGIKPTGYLLKLITLLKRKGYLLSKRGTTGGGIKRTGKEPVFEDLKAMLVVSPTTALNYQPRLPTPLPEPLTHRKCRHCTERLPVSRYFVCSTCVPMIPSIDDSVIYHGHSTYSEDEQDE